MKVYLMRHGAAQAHGETDATRKLTEQGIEDVERVAEQFALKQPRVKRLLASPYDRAQQTAATIREKLTVETVEISLAIRPDGDPVAVLDLIGNSSQSPIMLIAHNPLLSNLLQLMLDSSRGPTNSMTPGQLVCVSFDTVAAGMGQLEYTINK